jgi:hypothetical protein
MYNCLRPQHAVEWIDVQPGDLAAFLIAISQAEAALR